MHATTQICDFGWSPRSFPLSAGFPVVSTALTSLLRTSTGEGDGADPQEIEPKSVGARPRTKMDGAGHVATTSRGMSIRRSLFLHILRRLNERFFYFTLGTDAFTMCLVCPWNRKQTLHMHGPSTDLSMLGCLYGTKIRPATCADVIQTKSNNFVCIYKDVAYTRIRRPSRQALNTKVTNRTV
jgi:hypothetical protein